MPPRRARAATLACRNPSCSSEPALHRRRSPTDLYLLPWNPEETRASTEFPCRAPRSPIVDRRRRAPFALQCLPGRSRPRGGGSVRAAALALGVVARGLRPGLLRSRSSSGRRQVHSGAPRLGEPDRDRLLRRPRAMLPFADMLHLFPDELAGLSRRRLALLLVLLRCLHCLLLGHDPSPV